MISVIPRQLRPTTALTALLLALRLCGQTNIAVNAADQVRVVDDRMFGINAVMWDGYTSDPRTVSLVQAADLRMIRIPGGSNSDIYHWAVNKSVDDKWKLNNWTWSAGTDAFVTLISSTHANATAVANYGTGTPEEAAAWVAYMNAPSTLLGSANDFALGTDTNGTDWHTAGYWSALRGSSKLTTDDGMNFLRIAHSAPVGIKNWEIGNENYGTWEKDQQAVPHDPFTYANRAKEYIAKMKAVDGTIRIGVVAVPGEDADVNNTNHPATNPRTNRVHNGWTPVMLATLRALGVTPDALIYHRYEQAPFGGESDSGLLQKAKTWPNDAADLRQQLTDYLSTTGAQVELVVTENNSVYSDPGKQSTSLLNGLFYADSLGNILQTEFNEFCWWALRNGAPGSSVNNSSSLYGWRQYGDYGIISTPNSFGETSSFEPYPVYYIMKLTSHFARGGDSIVRTTSSNTLLAAYAAKRTNGTLSLLVINKDPTNDLGANIAVSGFTPKTAATVYAYGIPQDEAARTGSGSPDIATTTISNAAASLSMTFPHYSATVISFAQVAPVIAVAPTAGTVGTGANVTLSVIANGYAPLTYQWRKDGTALPSATSATLSLSSVASSNAGAYSVIVTDAGGASVTSDSATLSVSTQPYTAPSSTLMNISTRAPVGTGANVMIAGFVLGGSGSKSVLIRAVGPGLAAYGVPGTLADPQLVVTKTDGTFVASNDNWGSGDVAAITAAGRSVGAFDLPDGSKDAAMILTLPAGGPTGFSGYTATVKGANDTSGVAIIEVYDLDSGSPARLVNISTRAQVGAGSQAMIGGFAIRGSGQRKVLLRAVGPTLGQFMTGTLGDPMLTLTKQDSTPIASNDNWETPIGSGMADGAAISAAGSQTGGFALQAGSKDAALLLPLNAGVPPTTYTGTVEGVAGSTGIALIEAYEVP